ncbi:cupin domain-containing protein [Streptomyces tibetensis]|uniref:cupin domain-containing protein n=1 Tax=Streptomyces tibetensis TaxID=2382123 RepID=UPI0033ECA835
MSAVDFDPKSHVVNMIEADQVVMLNSDKTVLEGILGVAGVAELLDSGDEIGLDRITMETGAEFELHTHPGAHILYILSSHGFIHVDGVDYAMTTGDSVFVPANYPHGVKTDPTATEPLQFLAFGVPHMPIDSSDRMTVVH